MAEDHHPLDLLGQLGGQQQPVGPQRRAGARPAGRLGQQRPAGLGGEGAGARARRRRRRPRPCAGRGRAARSPGAVEAAVAGRSPQPPTPSGATGPAGTSGSSSWTLRCTSPAADRRPRPGDVDRRHLRPEDPDLVGGLVGVGAAQPERPVGGDDHQRHARRGGPRAPPGAGSRPRCRTCTSPRPASRPWSARAPGSRRSARRSGCAAGAGPPRRRRTPRRRAARSANPAPAPPRGRRPRPARRRRRARSVALTGPHLGQPRLPVRHPVGRGGEQVERVRIDGRQPGPAAPRPPAPAARPPRRR